MDTSADKVAMMGANVKTHASLTIEFFQALSDEGANVLMISISEIRIVALMPFDQLSDTVKVLHTAHDLDTDQIEAVVYGGTGH